MFPNIAGSSEHSETGTPWFIIIGSGCIGIEDVRRFVPRALAIKLATPVRRSHEDFVPEQRVSIEPRLPHADEGELTK